MRNTVILAATAGFALVGAAKADFLVTETRAQGPATGIFAGDDIGPCQSEMAPSPPAWGFSRSASSPWPDAVAPPTRDR